MTLATDFGEFIACLNARNVRYLVIGGYAVAAHGHPRYTKDLDVWAEGTPANVDRLLGALVDFGFASVQLNPADFLAADRVVQLGYPPLRIDLLTAVDGVDIGLDDLKTAKRVAGRPQDLADLDNLP